MRLSVANILFLAGSTTVLADSDTRTLGETNLVHADSIDNRIVGGTVVSPKFKYPYVVYASGCGASLVAPNVLLCAAHCQGFISQVSIGRHNLLDSGESYETFNVIEEAPHPNYNKQTLDYDYMMLKIDGDSTYAPVVLDDGSISLDDGMDATVMGWGTTSEGGFISNQLQEVEVDVWSTDRCNNAYGGGITDRMVCAAREGKDSCQGDSGGPIIDTASGKQIGVVSWGIGCARPQFPGVYAKVADQIDWINGLINLWSSATDDGTTDDGPTDDGLTDDVTDDGSVTEPPSSSPSQAPTVGAGPPDCETISRRRRCVKTQGCSWKKKNAQRGCFDALTSNECSRWDFVQGAGPGKAVQRRRCRRNGCIWENPQCNGRWIK